MLVTSKKSDAQVPMTLTPMGVATPEQVAPVVPTELFDYTPTSEDIQLPRFRLAQGLTPEVMESLAKAGEWLIPGKPAQKHLVATIMGIRKTRAKWLFDDQSSTRQIECSSPDAVYGFGDPGGQCATCDFAKWSPDPQTGRNRPPLCTLSYGYLLQTEEGDIGVYDASTKSANTLIGQLNAFYMQAGSGGVQVTLGSQLISKGARRYYSPTLVSFTMLHRNQVAASE